MELTEIRIEQAKKGDKTAQMQLYNSYSTAMFNTGYRILQDRMEAEDAMHDAFIKAFGKLDEFIGQVSFGAWLKRIVVNTCLDKLKKHKPTLFAEGPEMVDEPTAVEEAELELQVREVHRAIGKLPDGYRSILSLHLLEGFDHDEIAQVLGISSSTSRSQYSRARQALRKQLKTTEHV